MQSIEELNKLWAIPNIVSITANEANMPMIHIHNNHAQASIALQGAHITRFKPKGEKDIIWMSEDATYAAGKSLRGGVPVCWPWFGPHTSNAKLPGHGPARSVDWKIIHCQAQDDGCTHIQLEMIQSQAVQAMCAHKLNVQLHMTIGRTLKISITTENLDATSFTLTQALHTYFNVSDVRKVQVEGLDSCEYIDKMDAAKRKQQQGNVSISAEADRIYLSTPANLQVIDPDFKRIIHIKNQHSASAIIWNPWIETANKMGDLGTDGYLNMLCVETANAADDCVQIPAGESYCMSTEYSLENLS